MHLVKCFYAKQITKYQITLYSFMNIQPCFLPVKLRSEPIMHLAWSQSILLHYPRSLLFVLTASIFTLKVKGLVWISQFGEKTFICLIQQVSLTKPNGGKSWMNYGALSQYNKLFFQSGFCSCCLLAVKTSYWLQYSWRRYFVLSLII